MYKQVIPLLSDQASRTSAEFALACAAKHIGDAETARLAYESIARHDPVHKTRALRLLAFLEYNLKNFVRAADSFSEIIGQTDSEATILIEATYWRGMSYFAIKRFRAAIGDFDFVLRNPQDDEQRIIALRFKQKALSAIAAIEQVRGESGVDSQKGELSPALQATNTGEKAIHRRQTISSTEEQSPLKAKWPESQSSPNSSGEIDFGTRLATIESTLGDMDFRAAREASYRLLQDPDVDSNTKAKAQFLFAESYFLAGDFENAAHEYLRIDVLYPTDDLQPVAILKAARCYTALNRVATAKPLFQRLVDNYQGSDSSDAARIELAQLMETTHR